MRPPAARAAFLRLLIAGHASALLQAEEALEADLAVFDDDRVLAALASTPSEEDFVLAGACVEFERELSAREWAAFERVVAAIHDDGIVFPENSQERQDLVDDLVELRWHLDPVLEGSC